MKWIKKHNLLSKANLSNWRKLGKGYMRPLLRTYYTKSLTYTSSAQLWQFCPPHDFGQRLQTFSFVIIHWTPPPPGKQQRIIQPKTSIMLILRSPGLAYPESCTGVSLLCCPLLPHLYFKNYVTLCPNRVFLETESWKCTRIL